MHAYSVNEELTREGTARVKAESAAATSDNKVALLTSSLAESREQLAIMQTQLHQAQQDKTEVNTCPNCNQE